MPEIAYWLIRLPKLSKKNENFAKDCNRVSPYYQNLLKNQLEFTIKIQAIQFKYPVNTHAHNSIVFR